MSDMYLVLRSRLQAVKQWVTIDTAVMKAARDGRGLSYEAVARQIPCSAKTYERHEKRGRVPLEQVDRYAHVLGIEIERPQFNATVTVDQRSEGQQIADAAERLVAAASSLERSAERIEGRLDDLASVPAGRRRKSA